MGKRLLLADDSITIRKVVGIIFSEGEYELTVVDNGDAALEKAREVHPDVMLIDALMPGRTGFEVCQEVRRDPLLKDTPILLLIGAFEPYDEERTRTCGADQTISKPFESQQIIDRVNELLEVGKERQAAAAARPAPAPQPEVTTPAPAPIVEAAFQPAAPEPVGAVPAPAEPEAEELIDLDEEVVEATLEDDLWGAFELEAPPAEKIPSHGAPPPEEAPVFDVGFEEGFEVVTESIETAPEPEGAAAADRTEPTPLSEFDSFTFEPEEASTEMEIEEYTPEPVSAALDADVAPAVPPVAGLGIAPVEAPVAGPVITEAMLVEALSKISKDVIERIVWEVVPDLAERLVKEEIRRLKAGTPA